MTRDNLLKRGIDKTRGCLFCSDQETIDHLFFGCVVAKSIWGEVSSFFSTDLGSSYLSIAKFWPANKKHEVLNAFCACVLWCLWKIRNKHVFDNAIWSDIKQLWRLIWRTLKRWIILYSQDSQEKMQRILWWISCILKAPCNWRWGENGFGRH